MKLEQQVTSRILTMKRKIVEYKIITINGNKKDNGSWNPAECAHDFEQMINIYMKDGWEPVGGLHVTEDGDLKIPLTMYQVLVLYEDVPEY